MCTTAKNEWISLFTLDVENIWKTSPTELRMIIVIHYILQKEIQKFKLNINEEVNNLKQKLNLPQTNLNKDSAIPNIEIVSSENDHSADETIVSSSPKISRHRKRNYKTSTSPSLLNAPKETADNVSSLSDQQNPFYKQKENKAILPSHIPEFVDSSILIDDTPEGVFKKSKFLKKTDIKKNKSKNSSLTLTQLFGNITSHSDNVANTVASNEKKVVENLPKRNLFKDYDKIVIPKQTIAEYPHKTEAVRKKADRKQLPGWACSECKQYYEGLNLPPDKLKEKMNLCSKHRYKFEPLNDTPKGFWDVTIFSSQDD